MQQEIIKHYGYENQLLKLVEELRELEAVIINDPTNIGHLQEEMADVLNLLEQIIVYRGWSKDVLLLKEYKIKRQLARIELKRINAELITHDEEYESELDPIWKSFIDILNRSLNNG